ncbi:MAG TPA: cytochrome c [Acidobacteriota bacterium]|nr:cytochrome c [Acidobacteriota bacterium]
MKRLCPLFIAALLAFIPFSLLSSSKKTDGAELFRARCGTCHGEKGEGLASAEIPPINKSPMTVEQLVALITQGKSGTRVHYSPIVNIDEAGAGAIAEYMKKMK